MEWQFVGDDSWNFGVMVRGAVRNAVGQIYFDEALEGSDGGWAWMAFRGNQPTAWGVSCYRWDAMAKVEEALGVPMPEQDAATGGPGSLTDAELDELTRKAKYDGYLMEWECDRLTAEIRRLRAQVAGHAKRAEKSTESNDSVETMALEERVKAVIRKRAADVGWEGEPDESLCPYLTDGMVDAIRQAVAEEREACAEIVANVQPVKYVHEGQSYYLADATLDRAAAAIRARQ